MNLDETRNGILKCLENKGIALPLQTGPVSELVL